MEFAEHRHRFLYYLPCPIGMFINEWFNKKCWKSIFKKLGLPTSICSKSNPLEEVSDIWPDQPDNLEALTFLQPLD